MSTVTISLPESLQAFIDDQMAAKGYGSVSDYLASLVKEAHQRQQDERLEALLLEGLTTGGEDIEGNQTFWDGLNAEADQMAKEYQERKLRR